MGRADEHAQTRPNAQDADARRIHTAMVRANQLFRQKRYREARAAARELERLDPSAFMAQQIVEACNRELGRRRARFLALLVLLAVACGVGALVYHLLARARLYTEPEPGRLHVAEAQSRRFAVQSRFGEHRELEYAWSLLAADGTPVPRPERSCLKQDPNAPWAVTYAPSFDVARAGSGETVRIVAVRGVDAAGRPAVEGQWAVEVRHVSRPPAILGTTPPAGVPVRVPFGQKVELRVDAVDGDGCGELTYAWSLDGRPLAEARGPSWTFEPGPQERKPFEVLRVVSCQVANRHGEPQPQRATWNVVVSPIPPGKRE